MHNYTSIATKQSRHNSYQRKKKKKVLRTGAQENTEYFDDGDHWNKISVVLRLKPTMRFLKLTNKLRG